MSADGATPDDRSRDGRRGADGRSDPWSPGDGAGGAGGLDRPAPPTAGEDTRRRRLLALLDTSSNGDAAPDLAVRLARLCAVAQTEVGVDGAGITVMGSRDGGLAGARDQLAATDDLVRRLEELQLTTGEGPCLDAYAGGTAVLVADLTDEPTRWLAFGHEALATGAVALFSLPLQIGAIRLGTLDLFRASAGGLSRVQLSDALALAEIATEVLLEHSEPEPGRDTDARGDVGWLPDVHGDVHVASGMVSVQTGTDVGAALLRLRGFAYAGGEPLHDVARRVIEHSLVFDQTEEHSGGLSDDVNEGPPTPEPET